MTAHDRATDARYTISVHHPGALTTVQDLGRTGQRRHGVVVGGAADSFALRIANLLVGNTEDAAGLEATLTGPTLAFGGEMHLAICGARLGPSIDGIAVPEWRAIHVRGGSILTFGGLVSGLRAYIAVSGGIDAPLVMGSRGTYLRAGVGGHEGRALRRGDVLHVGRSPSRAPVATAESGVSVAGWSVSRAEFPQYSDEPVLRVTRGAQHDWFDVSSLDAFFHGRFTVTTQSDRMGVRLTGPSLTLREPRELISEAVCPGTVQVTPDGGSIVLLADCQTTGGYPKIAQIITVDLPVMAQVKPGGVVQFREVPLETAQSLHLARELEMDKIKSGIRLRLRDGTREGGR